MRRSEDSSLQEKKLQLLQTEKEKRIPGHKSNASEIKKGASLQRSPLLYSLSVWANQPSLIAPVGQASAQVPHSMQESASIT